VGSKTEVFSVRFILERGAHGLVPGTIFNVAETEVGAPTMIVPDDWLYSPMYIEVAGGPSLSATLRAVRNKSVVFEGEDFDIGRIVVENDGIIEVPDAPLLVPGDEFGVYLQVKKAVKVPCLEEVLIHMVMAPDKAKRR
jgi:hypothetical protein